MPKQHIINGTIAEAAGGAEREGLTVQAFDRELPSVEARAESAPTLLGAAYTDAEGRFEIAYSPQQVAPADAIPRTQRASPPGADVSFRVVDHRDRELTIRRVEARDREYRGDQIVFNAPPQLEVRVFVDGPAAAGDSEYEQWIALLAPAIADVALAELADGDINFLVNELTLEQRPEEQQQLAWLARSARLAMATDLPIEAFYSWGRLDRPARLSELAAVPTPELSRVLARLAAMSEGELGEALAAAIGRNIIPAVFRERIDDIVRRLLRGGHLLRSVTARLQDEVTAEPLAGYTITTYDIDAGRENRGVDITDAHGTFGFDFYAPAEVAPGSVRHFSFEVVTPEDETLPQGEATAIDLIRTPVEVLVLPVRVSRSPAPFIEEQLRDAHVAAPTALLEWLRGQEIRSFGDIRRRGGRIPSEGRPEVDPKIVRELEALADLDRISSVPGVSRALLDRGYTAVLAIAGSPFTEFINAVVDEETGLTPLDAARLHIMATVQTDLLNNLLTGLAADAANGFEV